VLHQETLIQGDNTTKHNREHNTEHKSPEASQTDQSSREQARVDSIPLPPAKVNPANSMHPLQKNDKNTLKKTYRTALISINYIYELLQA
jgi:hypothetical protein